MVAPTVRQDGVWRYLRIEEFAELKGLGLQKPHTESQ